MFQLLFPLIGEIASKLIGLIPDPNERARKEAEINKLLLEAATKAEADQREINKTEAGHNSIFVAGWRPFIGWVCGAALAWQFVLVPLGTWALLIAGVALPAPPSLDGMLWELIMGMLGLGGLRTFEKFKGKTR